MYQHSLERLLLFSDKEKRQEFNIPEDAWYELYELFTTTKYDFLDDQFSAIDFFNEVFFCLTVTYANEESAELLNDYLHHESLLCPFYPELDNPHTSGEKEKAREYKVKIENTNWYILGFVWAILKKQECLPPHVKVYLAALEHALNVNSGCFYLFEDFPLEYPQKYSFSFDISPTLNIHILLCTTEEWQSATDDFDKNMVNHIVHRFHRKNDRIAVITEIHKQLVKANEDPKSHHKVSMISHREKASETFLDDLLAEAEGMPDGEIICAEEHTESAYDGFAAYITRYHDNVMKILQLVAHMGNNQMPLLIKFIKALQQLGYVRKDCFDNIDAFISNASKQFDGVCFDKTNVKKQVAIGSGVRRDEKYTSAVNNIAEYLDPILTS